MGITIGGKCTNREWDMGYGDFMRLRNSIYDYLPFEKMCKWSEAVKDFLEMPDCDGKLTHRQCKEILDCIKDMPEKGHLYGYIGRGTEHCMTITDFKQMLRECYSHRCYLRWN